MENNTIPIAKHFVVLSYDNDGNIHITGYYGTGKSIEQILWRTDKTVLLMAISISSEKLACAIANRFLKTHGRKLLKTSDTMTMFTVKTRDQAITALKNTVKMMETNKAFQNQICVKGMTTQETNEIPFQKILDGLIESTNSGKSAPKQSTAKRAREEDDEKGPATKKQRVEPHKLSINLTDHIEQRQILRMKLLYTRGLTSAQVKSLMEAVDKPFYDSL